MKTTPKLHTRDMLWLIAIVALALAWLADRGQLSSELNATRNKLAEAHASLSQTRAIKEELRDLLSRVFSGSTHIMFAGRRGEDIRKLLKRAEE